MVTLVLMKLLPVMENLSGGSVRNAEINGRLQELCEPEQIIRQGVLYVAN